jgi:hypothetical protein
MKISTFKGFGGVKPKTKAMPKELERFRLPGNLALPPSYQDYAQHLGYGLTCGLFLIYIPMGDHCDSLKVRSQVLSRVNRDSVEQGIMDFDPDGSAELVLRLFPFAISENGDVLGWDLEKARGGEYPIYKIGSRAYGVRKAGRSLYEFIESCLDKRIQKIMGPGYSPLPPKFKPLVPA